MIKKLKTDINPKIMSKIRKVLALAEQGLDGEKISAQRMLDILFEKYGLTMSHFMEEEKKIYILEY